MTFPLPAADPAELGLDPAALARLVATVERHVAEGLHPGAQLAVARHGKLALFRSIGQARVAPEAAPANERSLWLMYSNTKVVTAATIWSLVEEGALRFGDTVAQYLPGFEKHGKEGITLIQLLSHQGGFPSAAVPEACWTDHALLRRTVCDFRLEWQPGTRVQYHPAAAHWVCAALIEAVTGQDFRRVIRERIIAPLGVGDELYVGLPDAEQSRAAGMYDPAPHGGGFTPRQPEMSSEHRSAGIPGGGGYGSARAMAAFYQMLALGGTLNGRRILAPRTIDYVTRNFTGDRVDDYTGTVMNRGLGPHIRGTTETMRGLGALAHPRSFGHGGVGSSYCWADPASGVSFAFFSNARLDNAAVHDPRMEVLSNIVHTAIG